MAKFCGYCGSRMEDQAAFCTNCGKAFITVTAQPNQAPQAGRPAQPNQTPQPVCRQQQSYGYQVVSRMPQRQAPVAPKKKKKGGTVLAVLLVLALLVTAFLGFVKPGFFLKKDVDPDSLINRVQITVPLPTGPEAIVRMQANIALQYYVEARMYLEKLAAYDADKLDAEEFAKLVNDAAAAFENADKMSACLERLVDLWMETDDEREAPKIKVLQTASADADSSFWDLFTVKAYAKDKSASELTAQEIVDLFDKAPAGKQIRTLAAVLGTDAKHAYAQLKIAQAELEGADAKKVAEQATTCIQVAKTLKTAGTVAGLVIAAAPVATGAVATMATGELIATGGGIVMGAVNTGLELTSTGATLYYGTDENPYTERADAIADSKVMKTANLVVGLAGLGYNVKNLIEKTDELIEQADKVDEYYALFKNLSAKNGKEASDLFGILSFGLGNLDPDEGTFMGISIDPDLSGKNVRILLQDTKIGTSEAQQEAMKKILEDAGYSAKNAQKAVDTAVEILQSGETPKKEETDPAAPAPAEVVNRILEDNIYIAPDSEFDLDDYIDQMEILMQELAAYEAKQSSAAETAKVPETTKVPSTKAPDTTKAETTAEPGLSGLGWIEPYSYFKVETVFDLYPLLSKYKPAAMKVRPIAYASFGKISVTNEESFIIDLADGAQTVYATTYLEGSSIDAPYYRHEITFTFTGNPNSSNLFSAAMAREVYRIKDGEQRGSYSADKCSIMNSSAWSAFINDTKAFGISELDYKFLFVIEEVYFP